MTNEIGQKGRGENDQRNGVIKNLWIYHKVRYRDLYKNATQAYTLSAFTDLYMVCKKLKSTP